MKKVIALAALISASAFAGAASAQTYNSDMPATSPVDVSVVNVTNDPSAGSGSRLPNTLTNPGPELIEDARAQLESDPALVDALAMKNVQLANVVHIQTAANGGKIVYVR